MTEKEIKKIIDDYSVGTNDLKEIIQQMCHWPLHTQEYAKERKEFFTLEARYKERIEALRIINDINEEIQNLYNNYYYTLNKYEDSLKYIDDLLKEKNKN